MPSLLRGFMLFIATIALSFPAYAEDVPKKQVKNLDEQIQDVKSETLSLGAQMRLLEEKLLYPSSTQVAVYVSLENGVKYRLDSIELQLDGKPAVRHLYTAREIEALQKGGVQRLYTGNVVSGGHDLQVLVRGKAKEGDLRPTKSFKFSKEEGPKVLEIHLADSSPNMITLRDW